MSAHESEVIAAERAASIEAARDVVPWGRRLGGVWVDADDLPDLEDC